MNVAERKRAKLNAIVRKYNGWHYPSELRMMYDELMNEGVIIPVWSAYSGHTHIFEVDGVECDNSRFFFDTYTVDNSNRVEYTIYFS